jgi:transcriptional regulator with XRE-family HTH domain
MVERSFGANLRAAREAAGLTQDALAKKLDYKRPTPISLWERGGVLPEPRSIEAVAEALDVAPAVLMRGVITPYDRLRGSVETAPPAERRTSKDSVLVRWTRAGEALARPVLLRHLALIEAHLAETGAAPRGAKDARYRGAKKRKRAAQTPAAAPVVER